MYTDPELRKANERLVKAYQSAERAKLTRTYTDDIHGLEVRRAESALKRLTDSLPPPNIIKAYHTPRIDSSGQRDDAGIESNDTGS